MMRASRRSALTLGALALLAALGPLWPLAHPARPELDRVLQSPFEAELWRTADRAEDPAPEGGFDTLLAETRTRLFGEGELGALCGTDGLGRCLLARLVAGARVSLGVATVATLASLLLGLLVGAIAGTAAPRIDALIMRGVDLLQALPLMLIVIFAVSLLRGARQADPDLAIGPIGALVILIGAISWLPVARVVRSSVLASRDADHMLASRIAGTRPVTRLIQHGLPAVLPITFVALTLTVPRVLLLEAFLSFLGLGVEAPAVSWGTVARQGFDALNAVDLAWWGAVFPGLAFLLTLLALDGLGTALSRRFDPDAAPVHGAQEPQR